MSKTDTARTLGVLVGYTAALTAIVGFGVSGIDAANASTERIGRTNNFNPDASLDTSQVMWGERP